MTTPTTPSLAEQVDEALRHLPQHWALAAETYPALAADWQRLRERERVLTEALEGLKLDEALTFEGRMDAHAFFSVDALEAARAALAPEPK